MTDQFQFLANENEALRRERNALRGELAQLGFDIGDAARAKLDALQERDRARFAIDFVLKYHNDCLCRHARKMLTKMQASWKPSAKAHDD